MSRVDSTVIVVSYRPGDWLVHCLRSVRDQAAEVIVVDNASPGGEASAVARRCGARPVRSRTNRGFAGGVRVGLDEARGDVVAVLNDDAVAEPGWLDASKRALEAPDVAAVTPKVLLDGLFAEVSVDADEWFDPGDMRPLGRRIRSITVDGREQLSAALGGGMHRLEHKDDPHDRWRWTAGSRPFYVPLGRAGEEAEIRIDGEEPCRGPTVTVVNHAGSYLLGDGAAGEYGLGAPDDGRFDEPAERFGFSGTAPVFRAETLRRLGDFAPQFFAYNEDTDWCLRAHLAGMRIVYEPSGRIRHRLSATSGGGNSSAVARLSQRNATLTLVRNAPLEIARPQVEKRLADGGVVARQLRAKLPWAVASRLLLARHWVRDPADVWSEWADRDTRWDTSPARPAAGGDRP